MLNGMTTALLAMVATLAAWIGGPVNAPTPPAPTAVHACVSGPGGPCGTVGKETCECGPETTCQANPDPNFPGVCVFCERTQCAEGQRWDRASCQCITPCRAADECKGALPDLCKVCPAGESGGCAHWSCVDNACQITYCE